METKYLRHWTVANSKVETILVFNYDQIVPFKMFEIPHYIGGKPLFYEYLKLVCSFWAWSWKATRNKYHENIYEIGRDQPRRDCEM